jgi:hypothetical protein
MELIGNGEPRSTIPRALSLLTSLQRRSAALLGPFLGGRSPPGAAACHTGASWFVPASACCPHCGGHSILTIPTHWAAQKSWLASYATRVIHPQPGPSCLSHLPPFAMQLILMATSVWLRHVGGSLKRWSTQRLPSVPIISPTHTHTHTSSAFGWSAPNTSLCRPHSHFGAISPTATATPTFSRPPPRCRCSHLFPCSLLTVAPHAANYQPSLLFSCLWPGSCLRRCHNVVVLCIVKVSTVQFSFLALVGHG